MAIKAVCIIFLFTHSFFGFTQPGHPENYKFDLDKFNELKEMNQNHYFLKDSTKITLEDYNYLYQMKINPLRSHYMHVNQYHTSTLTLKRSGSFFQRNPIGVHIEYDESGNITNKIQSDSVFTFSLEELRKKLISEYSLAS